MIAALIIILIFGGGFGTSLNLSDPDVLAQFQENVESIIPDQTRATNVSRAVYELNVMSTQAQAPDGLIEQEIDGFREAAMSTDASHEEVFAAVQSLEGAITQVNLNAIQGREVIRQNTEKREWKKLLKALTE